MNNRSLRRSALLACGLLLAMMALVCMPCTAKQAKTNRYRLQSQKRSQDKGCLLSLYDRQTQCLLWKLDVESVDNDPVWSADHQAVAVFVNRDPPNGNLLIWQAGRPLRVLSTRHAMTYDLLRVLPADNALTGDFFSEWDSVREMWWSPDKKRLLLRAFASDWGASDAGQLVCCVLKEKRFYAGPQAVRRAKWTGSQQVRYWGVSHDRSWINNMPPEAKVSRLWAVP